MTVARRIWLFAPAVAYMALLFAMSHRQHPPGGGVVWDKAVHVAAYAVLGVLFLRAFHGGAGPSLRLAPTLAAVAATSLYGLVDEYHQSFVPGRDAAAADVVADAIGSLTAVAVAGVWLRIRRRGRTETDGPARSAV